MTNNTTPRNTSIHARYVAAKHAARYADEVLKLAIANRERVSHEADEALMSGRISLRVLHVANSAAKLVEDDAREKLGEAQAELREARARYAEWQTRA